MPIQALAAGGPPALLGPASRADVAQFSHSVQPPEAGVLRHKPVSINLSSLDPATVSIPMQLRVDVFDGQSVTLTLDRSDKRGADNFTWYAKVVGFPTDSRS